MAYVIKAPAKYVQGAGELKNLGLNAKRLGNKFLVICSLSSEKRFGTIVSDSFQAQEKGIVFAAFHGEATKEEVAAKMEECKTAGCDAVVGLGGGKVIDTAKAVADNLGLPCIIVPTVASNDAPCSGVAVLYNDAGVVVKALMTKRNPDLVLVDTEVIASAPARLFAAGIGDALATWFEARACQKSGAKTIARGNVSNTAIMMARLCYDLLLQHGRKAMDAVESKTVTPALEQVIEASIYLSGLGFESGGLAAAHAINDGFAFEPQCHGCYHGEKVAFGTLVQLVLEKIREEELNEVLAFMKSVGLPMTLAQLGVKEIDKDSLKKVAQAACVPTQSTKNLSADIQAEDVFGAILEADKIGSAYLAQN
jgi:glycerol dehydrogenase